MKRNFIEINEDLCNGCGNCVVDCAEGALQIVDGKAKVINESFCDGLGACLGNCPTDALKIVEKNVAAFDEKAVEEHLKTQKKKSNKHDVACSCPGMAMHDFNDKQEKTKETNNNQNIQSQLKQWPIQLHLVNPAAPYFQKCNLLIAASCTAFSFGNFHNEYLKNHSVVIACPKLDNTEGYIEKLSQIITQTNIKSLTILRMEVPCCSGLTMIVKESIQKSGKRVPFLEEIISIKGNAVNG